MRHAAGALATLVAAVMLLGCSAGGEALSSRSAAAPAAIPVSAGTVVRKAMPMTIEAIGTAEPYSTVAVHSQVTGELTSVHFNDGDEVEQGQLLFTLDRRPLEAALQQAEATLERDTAQLSNAAAQLQRYQDLSDRGIATREQLDQTRTNKATLEAAAAADRAAVENARVQLAYASISAPLTGRTGKLMIHAGNLVRANDTTPLVVINQVSPIYVSFAVAEGQLPLLKQYMARGALAVAASPPTDGAPPSTGRVTFVDNAVDQSTGTITVRGTFANEDRRLWPGQFVNVVVTLDTNPNAIVVPATAVQDGQRGKFVFVVKADKTVEQRPITVARVAGSDTVVSEGLVPGETVVTDGQLRLTEGSRVAVRPSASEQGAAGKS